MTVMMDVWNCLHEDNSNQPRGDIEQLRLHDLRREAPKICSQITGFAERIFFTQPGFGKGVNKLALDQILLNEAESLIPSGIEKCSHGVMVDNRNIGEDYS